MKKTNAAEMIINAVSPLLITKYSFLLGPRLCRLYGPLSVLWLIPRGWDMLFPEKNDKDA